MSYVGIRGTNVYFPEARLEVDYLLKSGVLGEKVFNKIGVESVAVAAPDETPSQMAIQAARGLIERLCIDPEEIDLVVYVGSTTPDLLIWSPSAKVSYELGIQNALGFEVHLGCGGVQAAFQALKGMMLSSPHWNRALVVAADIWGPFAKNRTGAGLIFGDSAAAAILEKGDEVPNRLIEYYGFTNGEFCGLGHLAGGTPFSERLMEAYPDVTGPHFQLIDGSKIPELNKMNPVNYQRVAKTVMERSGWNFEDLSYMLFPSGRMDLMRRLATDFQFDHERTNIPFLKHQGDLGSPMMLVDLHNLLSKADLVRGDKVLVLSAGGGISWMGLTIEV